MKRDTPSSVVRRLNQRRRNLNYPCTAASCLTFDRSGTFLGCNFDSQFLVVLLAIGQRGASSISIGYHHGQKRLVAFAAGPLCVGGHDNDFGFALERAKASAVSGGDEQAQHEQR